MSRPPAITAVPVISQPDTRVHFVRSDGTLAPNEPSFLIDHRSPVKERWGGWFVTGTLAGDTHMGNALLPESQRAASFDRQRGSAITDVRRLFNHDLYLSPHSDVVALMVLGHQIRMHNLIARLHHTGTPAPDQIEELLRYLLFIDEAPLHGPVTGSTTFAAEFEKVGR